LRSCNFERQKHFGSISLGSRVSEAQEETQQGNGPVREQGNCTNGQSTTGNFCL